jgi:hypothetical protein
MAPLDRTTSGPATDATDTTDADITADRDATRRAR